MKKIILLGRREPNRRWLGARSGFVENRQKAIENLWIRAIQKDIKSAKAAFSRLLKLGSYHFPASILMAASRWDADSSPLLAEFNRLKEKLPIDIVGGGKIGAITKFMNNGIYGITDIGGRRNNEDAIAVFKYKGKTYLLLADGVGGHKKGEEASHVALLAMMVAIENDPHDLRAAIREAHQKVCEISVTGLGKKPGTTLCAAKIDGQSAQVAHIGDSPIYLLQEDGNIQLLTYPHSETGKWTKDFKNGRAEIGLSAASNDALGKMDLERPPYPFSLACILSEVRSWMLYGDMFMLRTVANSLTRVVGVEIGSEIPVYDLTLKRGDKLLLTSDGLDLTMVARDGEGLDEKLNRILGQPKDLQNRVNAFMGIVKSLQTKYSDNTTMLFYEGGLFPLDR